MFNSIVSKLKNASLVVAVLMSVSMGAHADGLNLTDLTKNIEQSIGAQMQKMMQVTQQELSLSLQAQLLQASLELEDSGKMLELAQEPVDPVIATAMIEQ